MGSHCAGSSSNSDDESRLGEPRTTAVGAATVTPAARSAGLEAVVLGGSTWDVGIVRARSLAIVSYLCVSGAHLPFRARSKSGERSSP